jgi:proteic killer suppression protein
MAIVSFADVETQIFFETGKLRKGVAWANIGKIARRKLDMVHYAAVLEDLRSPPGNRLELLSGNLTGFYSIRINDQWRVVFKWTTNGPSEVRITDYH